MLQLLTATSVRHGSTCLFGSLWLSSFLPLLMFKILCSFGVSLVLVVLRSLFLRWHVLLHCAPLSREKERERERLVCSVVNIPNVFKLS